MHMESEYMVTTTKQDQSQQAEGQESFQKNPDQYFRTPAAKTFASPVETAIRAGSMLCDLQAQALSSMWRLHARVAAAYGLPDYSAVFRWEDGPAARLLSGGTAQMLSMTRQASETLAAVNQQVTALVESRTAQLTQEVEQAIDAVGQHAEKGLRDMGQFARDEAKYAQQAANEAAAQIRARRVA
jgi:hypothetical protein